MLSKDLLRLILNATIVGKEKRKYLNISCAFDIETSSFYDKDEKVALMYLWQFGIYDEEKEDTIVITGRTWEEFKKLLNQINKVIEKIKKKENIKKLLLPCYIHNFSFEYAFLRGEFPDIRRGVFLTDKVTPLYADLDNVQFRCSYMLSGVALKYLPTKTKKMVGDLDYDKIRTPLTPITDKEMQYAINDIKVVCEYIYSKIQQDGDVSKIPYTKTGYVRRGLLEHCVGREYYSNKKNCYKQILSQLQIHTLGEWKVIRNAYTGGYTACNPETYGVTIYDVICKDFSSSYPSIICEPLFPNSYVGFHKSMTQTEFEKMIKTNCGYCLVTFHNIRAKWCWSTNISYSKCVELSTIDYDLNNGKVFGCKENLSLFITDIDYKIIKENYEWDGEAEFKFVSEYTRGYLPRDVIDYILKLYKDKTELKGIIAEIIRYCLAKEQINSVYGCMVTDVCKEILKDIEEEDEEKVSEDERVVGLLKKYNNKLKNVTTPIAYQYGVYISSIARRNLFYGIRKAGKLGLFLYCDTDSVYVRCGVGYQKEYKLFENFVSAYNNRIKQKMEKMCEHFGFDKNAWCPKTIKDVEKPLGYWDNDGRYNHFKSLGAKRYIKTKYNKRLGMYELIITVAGLGKSQGCEAIAKKFDKDVIVLGDVKDKCDKVYIKNVQAVFDGFENGLKISEDETGKLTHTFVREEHKGIVTDYLGQDYEYDTKGGVHLEKCAFELSVDACYLDYINGYSDYYSRGFE